VHLVEKLADHLASRITEMQVSEGVSPGWRVHVTHRELAREGHDAAYPTDRSRLKPGGATDQDDGGATEPSPVQAQEA
jgi:hypothetical protein